MKYIGKKFKQISDESLKRNAAGKAVANHFRRKAYLCMWKTVPLPTSFALSTKISTETSRTDSFGLTNKRIFFLEHTKETVAEGKRMFRNIDEARK